MPPTIIKKYGNRRLYDTGDSKYVTLDELAAKIRGGTDVRIVDAQTGDDLTQATLAQIILESGSGARVLPTSLLTQMVRLGDDDLADFFGRYVTAALEMYLQARHGVQTVAAMNPLASLWSMAAPYAERMTPFGGGLRARESAAPPYRPAPAPPPPERPDDRDDDDRRRDEELAELRRAVEELRGSKLGKPGAARRKKKP